MRKLKCRLVYADYAATTPVDPRVVKAMLPYFTKQFANSSSLYQLGVESMQAVERSRKNVAEILHAHPQEIIFTSGGTESDNLAIIGIAEAYQNYGKHIISVATEHQAVLEPLRYLKKKGFEISYIPIKKNGQINSDELSSLLRPETILVTVMYVNNELGTIQPIQEIAKIIGAFRNQQGRAFPFFHTDACQAASYLPFDVEKLHIDAMTLSGSKICGPKGSGVLFLKKGIDIEPLMHGGGQESGRRSGTENVAAIVGFAEALKLVEKNKTKNLIKARKIMSFFWKRLKTFFPEVILHGAEIDSDTRLPNIINIAFKGMEAEKLLLYLDKYGIMCSTGSACSLRNNEGSHVLKELGLELDEIKNSLRLSFSSNTSLKDFQHIIQALQIILKTII